jgi:6-phosphogluconolactonase (cycloisomerase 2 family)
MTRNIPRIVCLIAALCTQASLIEGQATNDEEAAVSSSSTVAYVYVSSTPKNGNVSQIEAFAANKHGKLTSVPGSPFSADEGSMAVNGLYLFAANNKTPNIDAYSIESNGALTFAASTNYAKYNPNDCGSAGPIFLDHTGSSLYVLEYNGDCSNNLYQSFAINNHTGQLSNRGTGAVNSWLSLPASFTGNDVYAYSASCLGNMYWGIFGFRRTGSGLLKEIGNASTPKPKPGDFYCPSQAAADPTNHLAVTMQAVNGQTFASDGAVQIASYTADASGNLSTTSTPANMPAVEVGLVNDINMSPSGKLLAVGGTAGLEIFHFNGAQPVTRYTGRLTSDEIDQFFWDNDNHLYAISKPAGKLFVFTVTPTSVHAAAGSPYSVSQPQDVIVQPWPLPWQ